MAEQKIKVVLFDLGKVLIDFDHKRAAERISAFCDKSADQVYNLFFDSPVTLAFEEGKITPEKFYQQVKEMLNLKLSYTSFVPIWNDIFFLSAENRSVYRLVNILRAEYKTALLSNINLLHYEYLLGRFPIFGVFDNIFLSFKMGLAKPNKEIYKKVMQILQISAAQIFYIDDRKELVDSAVSLGIKGHLFTNFKQLICGLQGSGVVKKTGFADGKV